ncbi:glutathione hydrolase 1 proenzyme-like [Antedon mediterranea]|uniref:glutathione hydrolase 1 proenzyme-like n=1 Tax=Antedon mediterranea TaxID=105859 RepID=UPI003AF4530A
MPNNDLEIDYEPPRDIRERDKSRKITAIICIILLCLIIFAVVLCVTLIDRHDDDDDPQPRRQFSKAAVATDIAECSQMGSSILEEGGSAVDSAITSLLCIGLVHGQSSGIGGGAFLLIYDRSAKKVEFINARETSPAATTQDMFNAHPDTIKIGGLAIATPGELKGMWEAHQKYGKLSWKRLFEPVIELARKGFRLSKHSENALKVLVRSGDGPNMKAWRNVYFKDNGTIPKVEGDIVIRSKFADTLQRIADNGWTEFYNGTTADMMIEDITNFNGTLTKDDLLNYTVQWSDVITTLFMGNMVASPSLPSGGPVYQFIINVMKGYDIDVSSDEGKVKTFHHFIETCKFAFGLRSYLGDVDTPQVRQALNNLTSEEFAREIRDTIKDNTVTYTNSSYYSNGEVDATDDIGGTSHLNVLAENGDAVSVTTSVNYYFGSKIMSESTGIIYNNLMADFSIPNSEAEFQPSNEANYPGPNKYPLSSMSGSIVLDKNGDVRLVVGSSGGKQIITANAWITLGAVATDSSLKDLIEYRRIHNQLFPNIGKYDAGLSETIVEGLENMDQILAESGSFAVVQAILQDENGIEAYSDSRKGGKPAGY